MRITINERKHAALSRQTVRLKALTSSPPAPQPCHHGYAPLPNWRPTRTTNTHFSGCQFTHSNPPLRATANLIPQPTGTTTPHTTTHTSQPSIRSPTSTAHTLHHQHPTGQPYNRTQTHPDRPIQPTRPKTAS